MGAYDWPGTKGKRAGHLSRATYFSKYEQDYRQRILSVFWGLDNAPVLGEKRRIIGCTPAKAMLIGVSHRDVATREVMPW